MGYCSCGNWVGEGEICSHCGGGGGSSQDYDESYDEEDVSIQYISRYEYFYRQGRASSIKGEHKTAIGFYNEALAEASKIREKCDALSIIAGEYEQMGDYTLAEEYWDRCLAVEGYGRHFSYYRDIAGKADFLYRMNRFKDAAGAYEEALMALDDEDSDLVKLKYYARITHFIINSYKRLGNYSLEGKYHDLLKRAIDRDIREGINDDETKAYYLSLTASEIYESDSMIDEALLFIDDAVRLHPCDDYNMKKAMLIKSKLELNVLFKDIGSNDLEMINEALKILPGDCDNGPYLKVKADILRLLGDPVKAKMCQAIAAGDFDGVDRAERQLRRLERGETYINITGTGYYQGLEPFKEGTVVDLIRESDNTHDPNAIRVEISGETVGYVANSKYSLIRQVRSATDIKYKMSKHAEVQFILFGEWVVAKLI